MSYTLINSLRQHSHEYKLLMILFLATLLSPVMDPANAMATSDKTDIAEECLASIRKCISDSPGPWPERWQREYLQTIHDSIVIHQNSPHYALRLKTLNNGFRSYWEGLKKTRDRPLFEVNCAQIRWYTGELMGSVLSEQEKQTLRKQWKDLWHEAAESLLTQFSFLDPNIVHRAEADHLGECYGHIEVPLEPIFLRPFTDGQIDRIKRGWPEMRYARVDLMRQLGGEAVFLGDRQGGEPLSVHPDYLLTQRSLKQWLGVVWFVVAHPPDYYRRALQNQTEAQRKRRQLISQGRAAGGRLRRDRSRQLYQTEYLSFLLAVLLESPSCLQAPFTHEASEKTTSVTEPLPPKEVMPME